TVTVTRKNPPERSAPSGGPKGATWAVHSDRRYHRERAQGPGEQNQKNPGLHTLSYRSGPCACTPPVGPDHVPYTRHGWTFPPGSEPRTGPAPTVCPPRSRRHEGGIPRPPRSSSTQRQPHLPGDHQSVW